VPDGRGEEEPARLHPGQGLDLGADALRQGVGDGPERGGVREERAQVAEQHAGLGKVGHLGDEPESLFKIH